MSLHGSDIANVLASTGPVVKCVILRHMAKSGRDEKPHSVEKDDAAHQRPVLVDLIEEIEVDTTPSKGHIQEILGGPFTFVGQFESEGTMAMAKKQVPEDLSDLSIKELRTLCGEFGIDTKTMVEKHDLIAALEREQLPINPHKLQPPLHDIVVRGDVMLLKVAETKEELDEEGESPPQNLEMMSNEEFFLDYTKKEYIQFASRTDIEIPPPSNEDSEEYDDDEEEISDDEEDDEPTDEGIDEDEAGSILNLIMGEVLKKFREENGRGPNTHEVLELRSQVAAQLGVEVPSVEEIEGKRPAEEDNEDNAHQPQEKKVKFTSPPDDDEESGEEDEEDTKPAAKQNS